MEIWKHCYKTDLRLPGDSIFGNHNSEYPLGPTLYWNHLSSKVVYQLEYIRPKIWKFCYRHNLTKYNIWLVLSKGIGRFRFRSDKDNVRTIGIAMRRFHGFKIDC